MKQRTTQSITGILVWSAVFVLISLSMKHFVIAQTPTALVMATEREFDTPVAKWLNLTYTEAFRRLNIPFQLRQYPLKRSALLLNAGQIDGDVARVYSFSESYSNVIRVEKPVAWSNFSAFATDPTISLDGWESLKGTAYRVEYERGTQLCEVRLSNVVPPENLSVANHWPQGLKKLQAGRINIFIGVEDVIVPVLRTDEYKDVDIHTVGVMEQIFAYPYFHKKHRDLVPEFEAVLKAMADEGLIENYRAIAYRGANLN